MRDKNSGNKISLLIAEIEEITPSTIIDIKSNGDPKIRKDLKWFLYSNLLEKTVAHYSIGDDKETVRTSLLETIPAFEDGFEFNDGYGDFDTMVWMVSLGILCDIELEDFKRITAVLERFRVKDKLLDTLIKSKLSYWPTGNSSYIQKYPYSFTKDISTAEDIKTYLNKKWYQGHSDAYWHDIHKNKDVNNYFGYWAWEVAALAKVKNIDDSSLKDQMYYPYDAVHW